MERESTENRFREIMAMLGKIHDSSRESVHAVRGLNQQVHNAGLLGEQNK